MTETTVLLVDDHKLLRDTWKLILEEKSLFKIVGETGDPEEALLLASVLQPQVILTDISMQPMNGFELTKKILALLPRQAIVGISMHAQPAVARKLINLGAKGYVTKNSPVEEMIHALSEAARGERYISRDIQEIMVNTTAATTLKSRFSIRELEIIGYIKGGLTSQEIALQLGVSKRTAETHRYNISKKLNVRNSISLVNAVVEMGL